MTRGRLFVAKTMRPDITKRISDRVYHDEGCPPSDQDAQQLSAYPGTSLKGCSKDGSDGKEGKDGKEGSDGKESCDLREFTVELDQLDRIGIVNLSERFRPQNLEAGPGPVIAISARTSGGG